MVSSTLEHDALGRMPFPALAHGPPRGLYLNRTSLEMNWNVILMLTGAACGAPYHALLRGSFANPFAIQRVSLRIKPVDVRVSQGRCLNHSESAVAVCLSASWGWNREA